MDPLLIPKFTCLTGWILCWFIRSEMDGSDPWLHLSTSGIDEWVAQLHRLKLLLQPPDGPQTSNSSIIRWHKTTISSKTTTVRNSNQINRDIYCSKRNLRCFALIHIEKEQQFNNHMKARPTTCLGYCIVCIVLEAMIHPQQNPRPFLPQNQTEYYAQNYPNCY